MKLLTLSSRCLTAHEGLDGPKLGLGAGDLHRGGAGLVEEQRSLPKITVLRHGPEKKKKKEERRKKKKEEE